MTQLATGAVAVVILIGGAVYGVIQASSNDTREPFDSSNPPQPTPNPPPKVHAPTPTATPKPELAPSTGGAGALNGGNKPPRNYRLAGTTHPVTGVPFNFLGFPDFTSFLYKNGPNDVRIDPTGDRLKDFEAANKAAGYLFTPKGYTWHHHEETGRMQLVESNAHAKTGHTGGFSLENQW